MDQPIWNLITYLNLEMGLLTFSGYLDGDYNRDP